MAINKVVYGNDVLIDLSSDTAEASDVAQGKTFHLKSGAQATGTALGGTSIYDGDDNTDPKYSELFLTDVASGVDTVKVGLDMDLLWTNSSPTSSFSAQTVSADLSGYSLVLIEVYKNTTYTYQHATFICRVGFGVDIFTHSVGYPQDRTADVTTTGITFTDAYRITSIGTAQVDNTKNVPYKIYGIK